MSCLSCTSTNSGSTWSTVLTAGGATLVALGVVAFVNLHFKVNMGTFLNQNFSKLGISSYVLPGVAGIGCLMGRILISVKSHSGEKATDLSAGDTPAKNASWQKANRETHQTAAQYRIQNPVCPTPAVELAIVGDFTPNEQKGIKFALGYFKALHVGVIFTNKNELKSSNELFADLREHPFHLRDNQLEIRELEAFSIAHRNQDPSQGNPNRGMLIIIKDDIYDGTPDSRNNFVFGATSEKHSFCIISTHRYNKDPLRFAISLAKTVSHEYGHLLGMPHCVQNACLMNGSNDLTEAESIPLIPCSEDMEKIAHRSGKTVKKLYEDLIIFFENASTTYGLNTSFEHQISVLQSKIQLLS